MTRGQELAAFRKQCTTTDHICVSNSLIDKYMRSTSRRLNCCVVDMKKAFDSVWHKGILWKLQKIGIRGNCYNVIKNMYTNSTIQPDALNGVSPAIPLRGGVQQGNTLRPALFNIFTNDTVHNLTNNDSLEISNLTRKRMPCLLYAEAWPFFQPQTMLCKENYITSPYILQGLGSPTE